MQKRTSVLFLAQDVAAMGGAESLLVNLAAEFGKGNKVFCVSINKDFLQAMNKVGAKVFRLPFRLNIIGNAKGLIKSILLIPVQFVWYLAFFSRMAQDVDIVFITGVSDKLFSPLIRLFGLKVVWIEHGPLSKLLKKFFGFPLILYRLVAVFANKIAVPSEFTKKDLVKNIGFKNVVVIPNGTKEKRYRTQKQKDLVICVSRLQAGKGHNVLIAAFAKVVKIVPSAKLNIVGTGDELSNLKAQVRSLKLQQSIRFTGWVNDAVEVIHKGEFVIFPSVWDLEGFGMVMIEAFSQKRPVIAFNAGPVEEIVDVNTGVIVKKADVKEFAKAIGALLINKAKARQLGENAYARFKKDFTIEKTAKKYLELFVSI